jgi:hypothetical protein
MQAPSDRAARDPEESPDLIDGLPLDVVRGQEGTVRRIEPSECPMDRVTLGERFRAGGSSGDLDARRIGRLQRDLPDTAATSELHPAAVDERPPEPRIEGPTVPKARQLAPGGEARLLDHVSCVGFASEDRDRDAVQAIDPCPEELLEGRYVAVTGALDELRGCRPHHVRLSEHRVSR